MRRVGGFAGVSPGAQEGGGSLAYPPSGPSRLPDNLLGSAPSPISLARQLLKGKYRSAVILDNHPHCWGQWTGYAMVLR